MERRNVSPMKPGLITPDVVPVTSDTTVPSPSLSQAGLNTGSAPGCLSFIIDTVHLRGDHLKAVVNLSSRGLSEDELEVLSEGLSFCPLAEARHRQTQRRVGSI